MFSVLIPGSLVALLAIAAIAPPAHAATRFSGNKFNLRQVTWWVSPIAEGEGDREPRVVRSSTYLNRFGGGAFKLKPIEAPRHPPCTLPELLAFASAYGSVACAPAPESQDNVLVDLRLVPTKPASTAPKFSSLGSGVDNLAGDRGKIKRALTSEARRLRNKNPDLNSRNATWEAALNLLENPLASRRTRQGVVAELADLASARTVAKGRLMKLKFRDTSHLDRVGSGAGSYPLRGNVELLQVLRLDPDTYDLRTSSTLMTKTMLPELEGWVESQDSRALIGRRNYRPVDRVKRSALQQRRVPCKRLGVKSDGICIDLGKPGGRYMTVGG